MQQHIGLEVFRVVFGQRGSFFLVIWGPRELREAVGNFKDSVWRVKTHKRASDDRRNAFPGVFEDLE
jgi:hypothetical protein